MFQSQSKEKVIIMELCQGGSLYSLLEEPENSYGVSEDEFLTILKDIGTSTIQQNSRPQLDNHNMRA